MSSSSENDCGKIVAFASANWIFSLNSILLSRISTRGGGAGGSSFFGGGGGGGGGAGGVPVIAIAPAPWNTVVPPPHAGRLSALASKAVIVMNLGPVRKSCIGRLPW